MALMIMALIVKYLDNGSFLCFLKYIKNNKKLRIANTVGNQIPPILDTKHTYISHPKAVILICKYPSVMTCD
jgi:hypothetical protein